MDNDEKSNNSQTSSNDLAADLQSAVDSLTTNEKPTPLASSTPPIPPPLPDQTAKEPMSPVDQKLQASWSESLPQTTLSDTINIEKEQVKLDQQPSSDEKDLRTVPLPSVQEKIDDVSLVADIIAESISSQPSVVAPETPSVGSPTLPSSTTKRQALSPTKIPFLLPGVKIMVGLIIVGSVGLAASLIYFKKIPVNLNLPSIAKKSGTLPIADQKIVSTPTVSPETKDLPEVPHRKLSWFVPTPPSTTPTDLTALWPEFTSGTISVKYPKEWQLVDSSTILGADISIVVAKALKPPPEDLLAKNPIEIFVIKSPIDKSELINRLVGEKANELIKTQVAVNNFQATRTTNEIGRDGEQVQRFFISISNQIVVITLHQQAQEDQTIFEIIANSIKTI